MSKTSNAVKVGIFVTFGLASMFVLMFVLGQKQGLFQRKLRLTASFDNVAGLMVGTPVRLAGVNVGTVDAIEFDDDARVGRVHVALDINKAYASRIRTDTVARLSSKGLLGDTIVDLSVGGADAAPVRDGAELRSKESASLSAMIEEAGGAVGEIRGLASLARERVGAILTKQVADDVGQTVHDLASMTHEARTGNGAVHQLLYDKKLSSRIDDATASAAKAAQDLQAAAHGITDDLAHGRGTVGALLKDPTVYEDMKLLLGNARRSKVLRTVIRYAVDHDMVKPKSDAGDPKER